MKIIKNAKEMSDWSDSMHHLGKKIGLVPTMGYLHKGHLSLVEAAKKRSDVVVVSLFVNPIQFGPKEDFKRYPRDLRRDKKKLDVDVLFIPKANEIYPPDFKTFVEVEELSSIMCGRSRPAHFRGVATVVLKLFNMVKPDLAFFGEKDYQQQIIIKRMVEDFNLPIKIIALPTVREFDGLAMSSRNTYLKGRDRKIAPILYQSLLLAKSLIKKGEKDSNKILLKIRNFLGREPHIRPDYVVMVNPETLQDIKKIEGKILVALAAHIGKTRLIDNLVIES